MLDMIDWEKCGELITVVVQDADTKEVLMQAYANIEAIRMTMDTGYAHYYSRARRALWKKGKVSGNLQKMVDIMVACDGDCLLYLVKQDGVACHTGERSCFYRRLEL